MTMKQLEANKKKHPELYKDDKTFSFKYYQLHQSHVDYIESKGWWEGEIKLSDLPERFLTRKNVTGVTRICTDEIGPRTYTLLKVIK